MAATTVMDGRALLDRLASPELAALAAHFDAHGVRLHLVGGPVRDLLCGRVPKDLDVTSAARPEQFCEVLSTFEMPGATVSVFDVGEAHGTTGVLFRHSDGRSVDVEHTTHRTEQYLDGSRTPTVTFGDDLAADLARRDFTLNAIAVDLVTGEITDLFDGVADLTDGVLRCPGDPLRIFDEDPLRICRLVRFAATRGWAPDETTAAAATARRDRLSVVSRERIASELWKVCSAGGAALAAAAELCDRLGLSAEVLGVPAGSVPASVAQVDDVNALWAVLARCSGDVPAWLAAMRATRRELRHTKGICAIWDSARGGAPDPVAARRSGPVAASAAAAAAAVFGFDPAPFAALARNVELFGPLPVSGDDALAAGLSGPAVGEALAEVTAAFCADTSLTRDAALAIIAGHANN